MRAAADILYVIAGFLMTAAVAQQSPTAPPAPVLRHMIREELEKQFTRQNALFSMGFWALIVLIVTAVFLAVIARRGRPADDEERIRGLRAELREQRQQADTFRSSVQQQQTDRTREG